jgi:magnesium transporter
MVTEFLSLRRRTRRWPRCSTTCRRTPSDYRDYDIQYAYVTDDDRRLVGVLPMRDMLLAGRRKTLARDDARRSRSRCRCTWSWRHPGRVPRVPVHGAAGRRREGRLVGVVERAALEHALAEEADETYRSSQGIVGGEELRTMPLWLRARRRLSWLSANIVLNVVAASVIAMHQDTLEAVIAIAVFLPIISDMSGCSGNQAVAVSMRELSLA